MDLTDDLDRVLQMLARSLSQEEDDNGVARVDGSNENVRENSLSPPNNNNTLSSQNKSRGKQQDQSPSTVKILKNLLQHSLKALKIAQEKESNWKAKYDTAIMENAKLQEDLRIARAQINPPHLNIGLSTGKRRRYASPSSSDSRSRSRSRSSNHNRRSRRSESPPQLSPAFTPRPSSDSGPSKSNYDGGDFYQRMKAEKTSPGNESLKRESKSATSTHRNKSGESAHARKPSSSATSDKSKSQGHTKILRSGARSSSGLKFVSENYHDNVTRDSKYADSTGNTSRRSRSKSAHLLTLADSALGSSKDKSSSSTDQGAHASATGEESGRKPTRSTSACQFSNSKSPPNTANETDRVSRSQAVRIKREVDTSMSTIDEDPPRKLLRSRSHGLVPPVLQKSIETESEEEVDAFTHFTRNYDDESEELVDIDEFPPMPLTVAPITSGPSVLGMPDIRTSKHDRQSDYHNQKAQSTSSRESGNQSRFTDKHSKHGSNKFFDRVQTSDKQLRSRSCSSSGAEGRSDNDDAKSTRSSKAHIDDRFSKPSMKLSRIKMEHPESKPRGGSEVSSFPLRTFAEKIDYSLYQTGELTSDVEMYSPNYFNFNSVLIKCERHEAVMNAARKDRSSTESSYNSKLTTAKPVSPRKKVKDSNDRFELTVDETENYMETSEPYYYYQSETNEESIAAELENDDNFKKIETASVEIPRWRERIFEPYDPNEAVSEDEENLDDQTYLKRHSKSEVNERRRKRWDSQRMREESYLERLKRRDEERENLKKEKRRQRGRGQRSDGYDGDIEIESFQPVFKDAIFLRNTDQIPVTIFGYPLPVIEPGEFQLPWEVAKMPRNSVKKPEVGKQQNANPRSCSKVLRSQPKR